VVRDIRVLPIIELTFIPNSTLKTAGTHRNPTERQNEKTRQKAGFSGGSEILEAFSGTLSGSTTWTRTRDPMINSHLLYQLSYRGMRRILLIEKDKSIILYDFSTCAWQGVETFYSSPKCYGYWAFKEKP
jgi:hypothetical protein